MLVQFEIFLKSLQCNTFFTDYGYEWHEPCDFGDPLPCLPHVWTYSSLWSLLLTSPKLSMAQIPTTLQQAALLRLPPSLSSFISLLSCPSLVFLLHLSPLPFSFTISLSLFPSPFSFAIPNSPSLLSLSLQLHLPYLHSNINLCCIGWINFWHSSHWLWRPAVFCRPVPYLLLIFPSVLYLPSPVCQPAFDLKPSTPI